MPWKMFLIQPAPFMQRSLRRFARDTAPGSQHYHDATTVIVPQYPTPGECGGGERSTDITGPYDGDARWPIACACGYKFLENDHRQVNEDRLWSGSPDGKMYLLRENPPGATWVSDWFPDEGPNGQWTGPDGKVWAVMLPSGIEWIIYSYSSDVPKRKWDVQGAPPNITVSPSIDQKGGTRGYHGFIKQGVIAEDCEGRKFEGIPRTA